MTTAITGREKKLLLFLGIFVILAVFIRFILMPSLDELGNLDAQISEAQALQQEIQMKVGQIDKLQTNLEAVSQQYLDATSDFFELKTNQEIGQLLTGMVEANNSQVMSMNITSPTSPITLTPYIGSALAAQEAKAKDTTTTDTTTTGTTTGVDPTTGDVQVSDGTTTVGAVITQGVDTTGGTTTDGSANVDLSVITAVDLMYEAAVTFTIQGAPEDIENLLDQLEAIYAIHVVDWRSDLSTIDGNIRQTTQINVVFYMCVKS